MAYAHAGIRSSGKKALALRGPSRTVHPLTPECQDLQVGRGIFGLVDLRVSRQHCELHCRPSDGQWVLGAQPDSKLAGRRFLLHRPSEHFSPGYNLAEWEWSLVSSVELEKGDKICFAEHQPDHGRCLDVLQLPANKPVEYVRIERSYERLRRLAAAAEQEPAEQPQQRKEVERRHRPRTPPPIGERQLAHFLERPGTSAMRSSRAQAVTLFRGDGLEPPSRADL